MHYPEGSLLRDDEICTCQYGLITEKHQSGFFEDGLRDPLVGAAYTTNLVKIKFDRTNSED